MAITIEKQFTIDASPDAVWAFLTDPARVAACLPGASVTEQIDDHTYAGKMNMKVGPVSTSYKGKVVFERLDRDALTAELRATGMDVQGRGGADMTMTSRLTPQDGGTAVVVTSSVNVTGILAQFGRGMIQDVSDQMFGTFTKNMRAQLAEGGGGGAGEATAPERGADGAGGASATSQAGGGGAGATSPTAEAGSTTGPEGRATAEAEARAAAGPESGSAPGGATGSTAGAAPVATGKPPTAARPAPVQEEVLDVGALGARVFGRMVGRMLRRPAFWVGLIIVLLVIYWLFVR